MSKTDIDVPKGYKMTDLGPLPKEWDVCPVSELVDEARAGGTPLRSRPEYWDGDVPFALIEDLSGSSLFMRRTTRTITHLGLANSSAWVVPRGWVLVSMYASIGLARVTAAPMATNQAILALLPGDRLDAAFMAHMMNFSAPRLAVRNVQSTQKNVNKGIVLQFEVPVPPLYEQRKIAAVLSAVQEAKEKTEAVIEAARELKKSLMKYLFTYGPVPVDEAENVPLKQTEIGEVPEGWDVAPLGDVVEVHDRHRVPLSSDVRSDMQGPYPYCGANGVVDHIDDYLFDGEFVLLAEDGGYWGRLQPSAYLMTGKFWVNNHAHIIQAVRDALTNRFLLYWLIYDDLERFVSGSTRQKLNQGVMKRVPVPLPPLPEQKKIAGLLQAVEDRIAAEEDHKRALEELSNTLLNDLMTAKIRVHELEVEA